LRGVDIMEVVQVELAGCGRVGEQRMRVGTSRDSPLCVVNKTVGSEISTRYQQLRLSENDAHLTTRQLALASKVPH
jgi:hypothetical protein